MGEYKEVLNYIYNLEKMGIKLGLKNIRHLLDLMGDPQNDFGIVHIAGTNGKGSTAFMIYNILREAGFSVGLFTSPHLMSYEERFQVDGECISPEEVVGIFDRMKPHLQEMKEGRREVCHPTFFEMTTAIAYQHFSDKSVDFAVMEVGLGGRLDATNAPSSSKVSAIVTISKDHTQYLGDSLSTIAFEKAGIIKEGAPVVVGVSPEEQPEAYGVIEKIAGDRKAALYGAGTYEMADIAYRVKDESPEGLTIDIKILQALLEDIKIPMMGKHQGLNASVAVGLAYALAEQGVAFTDLEEAVRRGLANSKWKGRSELRNYRNRQWLFDTAHNPEALEKVREVLQCNFPGRKKVLLFGVMEDKDYLDALVELAPMFEQIILMRPEGPRSEDPEKIRLALLEKGVENSEVVPKGANAVEKVLEIAQEDWLIVNTGSIFCVGDVLAYLDSTSL